MEYVLRTRSLTKSFKQAEVIKSVNMQIKRGEIYGFLGANGAGKTTIMKMIVGLIKPTMGSIELFGEELPKRPYEVLKRIGAIIEYPNFYNKLTAQENLKLHCDYMGYYDYKEIDKALRLVNLTGTGDKRVENFSLGMKQRLGIARAIVTKPEFLILDEPINGLDPQGIKEVRELIKMLSKEYNMTVMISSHILAEIEHIADTVGVINKGQLIKQVSMDGIKNVGNDYIEISVNDTRKALYVLDKECRLKNLRVDDDNKIRIYDFSLVNKEQVTRALVLNNVDIDEISQKKASLEEYFFKLVKGDGIDA